MLEFHIHNLRRARMPLDEPRHVYVGRAVPRRGVPASPLANPYRVAPLATAEQAIAQYRVWLDARRRDDAADHELERLAELAESGPLHLWCWCAPSPCHADVIADVLNELVAARRARQ